VSDLSKVFRMCSVVARDSNLAGPLLHVLRENVPLVEIVDLSLEPDPLRLETRTDRCIAARPMMIDAS
jgi:hypothetical protein